MLNKNTSKHDTIQYSIKEKQGANLAGQHSTERRKFKMYNDKLKNSKEWQQV